MNYTELNKGLPLIEENFTLDEIREIMARFNKKIRWGKMGEKHWPDGKYTEEEKNEIMYKIKQEYA